MNGDAAPMRYHHLVVAVAMVLDESSGLVRAEDVGISADIARSLRDKLMRQLNAALVDRIAEQDRRLAVQTEELAKIAQIAEEYRLRRHPPAGNRGAGITKIMRVGVTFQTLKPKARAWAVAHLPSPVLSVLKAVRAKVDRT